LGRRLPRVAAAAKALAKRALASTLDATRFSVKRPHDDLLAGRAGYCEQAAQRGTERSAPEVRASRIMAEPAAVEAEDAKDKMANAAAR